MVAYSSIAHIGLMCLAIFATTEPGIQGVMIQMFNHGINIIGLWIVVYLIEKQFNTRKISELGGLAQSAGSHGHAGDHRAGQYCAATDQCIYRRIFDVQWNIFFQGNDV